MGMAMALCGRKVEFALKPPARYEPIAGSQDAQECPVQQRNENGLRGTC
jgi:hypothetical protein